MTVLRVFPIKTCVSSSYLTLKTFIHPSLKSGLKKPLTFAEALLSDDDKAIIHRAKKSLLFNDPQRWSKSDSGLFDVTMGAYDGAQVCELVGNYVL